MNTQIPLVVALTRALTVELNKPYNSPSAKDLMDLAYAVHAAMVGSNMPELTWMETTFEDVGDVLSKAIFNASVDVDPEPDDLWMKTQDRALESAGGAA